LFRAAFARVTAVLIGCMEKLAYAEAMPDSISVPSAFIMAKNLLLVAQMEFVMCFSADVIYPVFIARITRSAATVAK